jgi:hypothetical protein
MLVALTRENPYAGGLTPRNNAPHAVVTADVSARIGINRGG